MLSRTSFRFSADGSHAACLAAPRPGDWRVEAWPVLPVAGPLRTYDGLTADGPTGQVLPTDDGRVLLCQPLGTDVPGHAVTIGDATGTASVLTTVSSLGLRIMGYPRRDVLAIAISTDSTPELASTLWLLRDTSPAMTRVCTVSGLLAGGSWLDTAGERLGLNQAHQGRLTAVVADLTSATVTPLWPDDPAARLLTAMPRSGRLVVGAEDGALGWTEPGGEVHWSSKLDGSRGAFPLAADPSGQHVALRLERGAHSGLAVYTPLTDAVADVLLPTGTVGATASWVGDTLRLPFADGDSPAGVIAVTPRTRRRTAAPRSRQPGERMGLRLESFAGPVGPVESVVSGDWRAASRVLVALHGGPDSAWRLDHGPLLAELAGPDIAVVAVNPRGSHGYRGAHEALHAGWGNADLADVLAVAATVTDDRGEPAQLFGVSYGAFLAMLALATVPQTWARAAVVAPFLSGPRLYADGGARVRALLDRFGGNATYADELGPRELTRLAEHVTAPLLLVHGAADRVVPVAHSRELADRLRAGDNPVEYLELADAGHDPFSGPAAATALARIRDFLTGAAPDAPVRTETATGPRGGSKLALERR